MNTLFKNLRSLYNAKTMNKIEKKISLPHSILSFKALSILKQKGFIKNFDLENKKINVYLPMLKPIETLRVSQLARPLYIQYKDLKSSKKFSAKLGLTVFSTPQGLLTYSEMLKNKTGGLFLFQIT